LKAAILIFILAPALAFAQPDTASLREDVTGEAAEALKYDRCEDALNILVDYEREGTTLTATQQRLKAEAFACLGSLKTAIALYSDLLKADADNTRHIWRRATLYGATEQWKKALADCRKLAKLIPDDTTYCKRCGELAVNAKRFDAAINFLSRLPNGEREPEVQHLLALSYAGQKKYSQALLAINRCLALQPDEASHRAVRAQLYEFTEMPLLAVADYQAYLSAYPADHRRWLQYALLLRSMGRTAEACKAFVQAEAQGNLDAGKYRFSTCR
jgi:tetratricopeptide (TPR) repeat protein